MHNTGSQSPIATSASGSDPFPPDPPVQASADLEPLLVRADRALERLDAAVATLPAPEAFLAMHRRCEAVQSCLIDGTSASLPALLAAESGRSCFARDHPAEIARRCLLALEAVIANAADQPLEMRALAEMHATMDPGPSTDDSTATPRGAPEPAERTRGTLERFALDLERCLDGGQEVPDLVRVGLAQGQLEVLRPFSSANGRLARLLVVALAQRLRIPGALALSLSPFLSRHLPDYRVHIQAVRTTASWQSWIGFFLEGVAQAATDSAEVVRRFAAMRERHRGAVAANLGHAAARGLRVLDCLFDQPHVTVADIRGITGTTYAAANQLASRFAALGILEESTGQRRNRRFQYGPYLGLFDYATPPESGLKPTAPPAPRTTTDQGTFREVPAQAARPPRIPDPPRAAQRDGRPASVPRQRRMKSISDHLL